MNSAKPAVWTYTSDSCGYMLYKNGVAQGGARTLGTTSHTSDGRRRHYKTIAADRAMHRAAAEHICAELNRAEKLS